MSHHHEHEHQHEHQHELQHERDFVPGLGRGFLTPFYDVVHRVFGVGRLHRLMIGLADPQPGMRVVDVGCATGNLLITLARQRPGLDLVGLDPDESALARAIRKARRRRLAVDWRVGFAQELPFPDGSVDVVFSSLMLHHLDESSREQMLAELHRVLRPAGVLVLADVSAHDAAHHRHGRGLARHLAHRSAQPDADPHLAARLVEAGFHADSAQGYALSGLAITVVRAHR